MKISISVRQSEDGLLGPQIAKVWAETPMAGTGPTGVDEWDTETLVKGTIEKVLVELGATVIEQPKPKEVSTWAEPEEDVDDS